MKIISFLKTPSFRIHLVVAILTVVIGFFALMWWMGYYTRHGQRIVVPNLAELSFEEATQTLEEMNLAWEVLDSSEYTPEILPGGVVGHYPTAGMAVKENRVIRLTLNPLGPRKIEMPNIVDKTKRRAIYDLESKGFEVGQFVYKPYLGRDVVLGMEVKGIEVNAGQRFDKGTRVDLILGQGLGEEMISVPYLRFLSLGEAKSTIRNASLNLGLIMFDDDVTDTLAAVVYRQYPPPSWERNARLGSNVDIWLTQDYTKIPNDSLEFQLNDPGAPDIERDEGEHGQADDTNEIW